MKTPSLLPRKFKIDHDANEYHYFVEWALTPEGVRWTITNPDGFCLRANYAWDYQGFDTLFFETPEAALEGWKKYIEARDHGSSRRARQ